jgi:hypothetical protein
LPQATPLVNKRNDSGFFAELRRLGYVEGENLIIERYSAEGRSAFLACLLVLNDLRHFGRVYAMAALSGQAAHKDEARRSRRISPSCRAIAVFV